MSALVLPHVTFRPPRLTEYQILRLRGKSRQPRPGVT